MKYKPQDIAPIITELGLSKKDACAQMGITYACLHSWESGKRTITPGLVDLLIAKHLLRDADVGGRRNKELHTLLFTNDYC